MKDSAEYGGTNDRADHQIKCHFLSKVLMQEPLLEHKGKSMEGSKIPS